MINNKLPFITVVMLLLLFSCKKEEAGLSESTIQITDSETKQVYKGDNISIIHDNVIASGTHRLKLQYLGETNLEDVKIAISDTNISITPASLIFMPSVEESNGIDIIIYYEYGYPEEDTGSAKFLAIGKNKFIISISGTEENTGEKVDFGFEYIINTAFIDFAMSFQGFEIELNDPPSIEDNWASYFTYVDGRRIVKIENTGTYDMTVKYTAIDTTDNEVLYEGTSIAPKQQTTTVVDVGNNNINYIKIQIPIKGIPLYRIKYTILDDDNLNYSMYYR